jgi:hypothetical protein
MNSQLGFFLAMRLIAAVAVYNLVRMARNGGFRGGMFGARIARRTTESNLGRHGLVSSKVKVYVLEPRDPIEGPHVGVELTLSTVGSWEMRAVPLTRNDARKLADALQVQANVVHQVLVEVDQS